MSLHRIDYLSFLAAISAVVHTVQQVMPQSAGAAKLDAAVSIVNALVPTVIQTVDDVRPVINAVVAAAKSAGGTLAPAPELPQAQATLQPGQTLASLVKK